MPFQCLLFFIIDFSIWKIACLLLMKIFTSLLASSFQTLTLRCAIRMKFLFPNGMIYQIILHFNCRQAGDICTCLLMRLSTCYMAIGIAKVKHQYNAGWGGGVVKHCSPPFWQKIFCFQDKCVHFSGKHGLNVAPQIRGMVVPYRLIMLSNFTTVVYIL